jgi:hypothetical protein
MISYLRLADANRSGIPETYRQHRAPDAEHVVRAIQAAGGEAVALEADLSDPP